MSLDLAPLLDAADRLARTHGLHVHNGCAQCEVIVAARGIAPFLTAAEVATMWRISSMTVYRMLVSGELPSVRVGKSYRIRMADAIALAEAQP